MTTSPATGQLNIDLERLHALGMVTADGARSTTAEDFRILKRPVLRAAFGPGPLEHPHRNLVLVTSALAGEGKTYCALNLALSIAMERDHTVLLVDADVARPALPKMLGVPPGPGLMDLLISDEVRLADLIRRTNIASLSLLPAGCSDKHATELLASQAMSDVLDDIASRYPERIVLFDAPPLLLTSEAHVLAARAGQVLLVIEAEVTPQRAVREALRRLEHCAHIRLICNKARPLPGRRYHAYYD
jgi:exopolysaccharide/PEP-CTERM locus tyrosine autokinase